MSGKVPILIVSFNDTPYIRYTAYQALELGHRVVLIGSTKIPHVEFFDIKNYTASANEFAKIYIPDELNNPTYELFCYARWFMIKDFLGKDSTEYLVLDHDQLVYPQLSKLEDKDALRGIWPPLIDKYGIKKLTDYFTKVYLDKELVEKISIENKTYGKNHISDVVLWNRLDGSSYLNTKEELGIDPNIKLVHIFEGHAEYRWTSLYNGKLLFEKRGLKKVWWDGNQPYCRRKKDGQMVPMCTLHFQGGLKPFMQVYNTITDEKYCSELPTLAKTLPDNMEAPGALFQPVLDRGKVYLGTDQ